MKGSAGARGWRIVTGSSLVALALLFGWSGCGPAPKPQLPIDKTALALSKLGFKIPPRFPVKHMGVLDLTGTQMDDESMSLLENMPNLTRLTLRGLPITDAGLKHLSGLKYLRSLQLNQTKITDEGLAHIAGLIELRELSLRLCNITDIGMAHLSRLVKLEDELQLGGTKITDDGLVHLKAMKNLEELFLDKTDVTDAGLVHLEELTSAKQISLRGTKVTLEGVNALRWKLHCNVHCDPQLQ
jgi:Leucine-rich repeat (LRR) protein